MTSNLLGGANMIDTYLEGEFEEDDYFDMPVFDSMQHYNDREYKIMQYNLTNGNSIFTGS